MRFVLLLTATFLTLNTTAFAQDAESTYLNQLMTEVSDAASLYVDESSRITVFDAYCKLLKGNANLTEITSSVLGVRYKKRTGEPRDCRKACIWESANDDQKARLTQAFHSVLAFKLDTYLTPVLVKDKNFTLGSPQASRFKYSSEVPVDFAGGDLAPIFTITNLDRVDANDAKGDYLKNYFQNGPYKSFPHRIFLYGLNLDGISLRDFYKSTYAGEWNKLIGLDDSEKVEKIIEFMNADTIQKNNQPYLCK